MTVAARSKAHTVLQTSNNGTSYWNHAQGTNAYILWCHVGRGLVMDPRNRRNTIACVTDLTK